MPAERREAPRSADGPPQRRNPPPPRRTSTAIALFAIAVGGAALIAVFSALRNGERREEASPMAAQVPSASEGPPVPASPLKADRDLHEFGDVPIDGGLVETTFTLTNSGKEPTRIVAAYTSCMCTTASLTFADGATEGPFGMPGHDLPITLDREVASGADVTVTVRFDPAAHGPDATGPVERMVAVHTADGGNVTLTFTANVVKR